MDGARILAKVKGLGKCQATCYEVKDVTRLPSGGTLAPNGLEICGAPLWGSRPAGEGRAAWAETSCTGVVPSAQDQLQGKDTPAARPESISGSWPRDPAGQAGSIELLGSLLDRRTYRVR